MTLWLNTTIPLRYLDSSISSSTFNELLRVLSMGSRVTLRTSCIKSISKLKRSNSQMKIL